MRAFNPREFDYKHEMLGNVYQIHTINEGNKATVECYLDGKQIFRGLRYLAPKYEFEKETMIDARKALFTKCFYNHELVENYDDMAQHEIITYLGNFLYRFKDDKIYEIDFDVFKNNRQLAIDNHNELEKMIKETREKHLKPEILRLLNT